MSALVAERLAAAGIERLAEVRGFVMYGRGSCVAFASTSIGSTGYLTANGIAWLTWRDGRAILVAKGSEVAAEPEQVTEIQSFSEDLKNALSAADERG